MNKETSDRVSSIAARIMQTHPPITAGDPGPGMQFIEKRLYEELLADAKTLAGSVMSQDETAGTRPEETFITRLQRERDDLDERLTKLTDYASKGYPGATPRHKLMLEEQNRLMSELLAVLDERLCDLGITARSEISDDEDLATIESGGKPQEPEFMGTNQ